MTKHVIIVGGGMAGLTAARELSDVRVTLVEASDRLGGRILANTRFIPGHALDLGAEFFHGTGTLLTNLVEKYWGFEKVTQELYISAHADGGPSDGPTKDGYYGMYYMNKELMHGDDPRLKPLHTVFQSLDEEVCTSETSVGNVLEQFSGDVHAMAVSGYANTIGCTDMHKVSLQMMNAFEKHWEEKEIEGDFRIHSGIGMQGIVDAFVKDISQTTTTTNIKLNFKVKHMEDTGDKVRVVSDTGQVLLGDAVIVTVPPPMLTQLGLRLPDKKLKALEFIGFENAIKFVLKFSHRLWPSHLQSVICAESLVPEMWFRDFLGNAEEYTRDCFVAVCYLTSDLARALLKVIDDDGGSLEKASKLVMHQLSKMLKVPISEFKKAHVDSLLFDWSSHPTIRGGYMYPKVGMTRDHLFDLAEPWGGIFFAGEATNTNACCTVQAAMETGARAANQVRDHLATATSECVVHGTELSQGTLNSQGNQLV